MKKPETLLSSDILHLERGRLRPCWMSSKLLFRNLIDEIKPLVMDNSDFEVRKTEEKNKNWDFLGFSFSKKSDGMTKMSSFSIESFITSWELFTKTVIQDIKTKGFEEIEFRNWENLMLMALLRWFGVVFAGADHVCLYVCVCGGDWEARGCEDPYVLR